MPIDLNKRPIDWEQVQTYLQQFIDPPLSISVDLKRFLLGCYHDDSMRLLKSIGVAIKTYVDQIQSFQDGEVLDQFYAFYGKTLEQFNMPNIYCHRGCSNCCYQPVMASKLEKERINRFCEEEGIALDFKHVTRRQEAIRNFTCQKEWQKLRREEMACPYLNTDSGTCRIYEVRPLLCRNFFALNTDKYCGQDSTTISEEEMDKPQVFSFLFPGVLATVFFTMFGPCEEYIGPQEETIGVTLQKRVAPGV